MNRYYKTVAQADVVFAPSAVVSTESSRFQEAYNIACDVLGVSRVKQVGRSSFQSNKLRTSATEIATFWIGDDNHCKFHK